MKKIVLLSVILISAISFAQAGEPIKSEKNNESQIVLKGKVIDKKTGETLVGAVINVENSDYKTYTDLDGNFEIKNIKEGNYTNPEIFEISDELTKRGYHSLVMYGSD